MDMESFIQNEYDLFLAGRLSYKFILIDSFHYLMNLGILVPTGREIRDAYITVKQERQRLLQNTPVFDNTQRTTYWTPNTQEEKRFQERKFNMWHTMQLLVYRWYEQQKNNNVKKLFNCSLVNQRYMPPKSLYCSGRSGGAFPLYSLPY